MSINYSHRIQFDNQFRFWISVFTLLTCGLFLSQGPTSAFLSVTLLFISYTTLFGMGHLIVKYHSCGPFLHYLLIAGDSLAITGAIYLTGDLRSPLYILYIILFGVCIYHGSLASFVYSLVLSFSLYSGLAYWFFPTDKVHLFDFLGQVILIGVLTGVLAAVLLRLRREKNHTDRLVSKARTVAHISDILSGSLSDARDWVKTISGLIEQEIRTEGLLCRITIHKGEKHFLPPSKGGFGIQVPITVSDHIYGALIVTNQRNQPLVNEQYDFFSSIAKSIGLCLHRSKLWEEFQVKLERLEASLLLNSTVAKDITSSLKEEGWAQPQIRNMVDMVQSERGDMKLKKEVCDLATIIGPEMEAAEILGSAKKAKFGLEGNLHQIPPFLADKTKLKKLFSYLLYNCVKASPDEGRVTIWVGKEDKAVLVTFTDQGQWAQNGLQRIPFDEFYEFDPLEKNPQSLLWDMSLIMCKKIVDIHKGRIWSHSQNGNQGRSFSIRLPIEGVSEPAKISKNAG